MTDRSTDGTPEALVSRLIRAGAEEVPPPRTLRKALAAVGLGVSSFGAATTAAAVGSAKTGATLTTLVLVKWAGVGVTSGAILAIAAHSAPWERGGARTHVNVRPPAIPSEVVSKLTLPSPLTLDAGNEAGQQKDIVPVSPVARAESSSLSPEAPLAAEVMYVDRGRAAYQRGDAAAVLVTLEGYELTFPRARLLPEVLYLRMDAYRQTGQQARALELARRLTGEFPRSPHVGSARRLLEGKEDQ
jgi:hypothetical protein